MAPLEDEELRTYELRLREGRAHDALHEMRQHLRIRTHLHYQKDKYARGVQHNTRSPHYYHTGRMRYHTFVIRLQL